MSSIPVTNYVEKRDASTANVRIRSNGRVQIRYRGTKEWIDVAPIKQIKENALKQAASPKSLKKRHVTHHHAKIKPASVSSTPVAPKVREKPFYTADEVERIEQNPDRTLRNDGKTWYLVTPGYPNIDLGPGESIEEVLRNKRDYYPVYKMSSTEHVSSSSCGSRFLDGLFAVLSFISRAFSCFHHHH